MNEREILENAAKACNLRGMTITYAVGDSPMIIWHENDAGEFVQWNPRLTGAKRPS